MVASDIVRNHWLHIDERVNVAADSIEREILIEAPAEVVWGVITEPEQISRWFTDEAEVEARPGGAGTLTWRPGGRGGNKKWR